MPDAVNVLLFRFSSDAASVYLWNYRLNMISFMIASSIS